MNNLTNDFEARYAMYLALGGEPKEFANIFEVDLAILDIIESGISSDFKTNHYMDADGRLIVERGEDGRTVISDEHENPIIERLADGTTKIFDAYQGERMTISANGDITFQELTTLGNQVASNTQAIQAIAVSGGASTAEAVLFTDGESLATKMPNKTEKVQVDILASGASYELHKYGETAPLTFGELSDMLLNSPDFVVFVHDNREHRCVRIELDGNPKYIELVSPIIEGVNVKAQSFLIQSMDGVQIFSIRRTDIICENKTDADATRNKLNDLSTKVSEIGGESGTSVERETPSADSKGYYDINGEVQYHAGFVYKEVDITGASYIEITSNFDGVTSYIFILDENGDVLYSAYKTEFVGKSFDLSKDYPTASILKLCGRNTSPCYVDVFKTIVPKTLNDLKTKDKSSIISAINELVQEDISVLPDFDVTPELGSYYYGIGLNNKRSDENLCNFDIVVPNGYNYIKYRSNNNGSMNIRVQLLDGNNNVIASWYHKTTEAYIFMRDFPSAKRVVVSSGIAVDPYVKLTQNNPIGKDVAVNFIEPTTKAVCQMITSNTFGDDAEYLVLYCHGNGQDISTYNTWFSNTSRNYFKSHKINFAAIQMQGNIINSGWGAPKCVSAMVTLYNYLMEHYSFHKSVILAAGSMGGLTMGQLAYKKPFPILFCLGVGVVPDLEYMFNHATTSHKSGIRSAYGMSADGSDDANIAEFVKGSDWHKMGLLIDNVRVGYPNFYLYYGMDSVFRDEFGGIEKYTEVYNSLINGGVYSIMKECGTNAGHATPLCYDESISDGVWERELAL